MRSHKALFIGTVLTIAIVVGATLLYWFAFRPPQLILTVSSDKATVTLDGSAITHSKYTTSAGTHQLSVSASGFVPYAASVTVRRAQVLHINVLLKSIPSPVTLSTNVTDTPTFVKDHDVFFSGDGGHAIYKTSTVAPNPQLLITPVTPNTLSGIERIMWKPDGSLALLKKTDGIYLYDFMRYDLLHQTSTLWGTNIDDIVWDPAGTRLAYTYFGAGGEQSLKFADIQNQNVTIVADLAKTNIDHPTILWSPDEQSILLIPTSAQKKTNYLYIFDVFTKKISQLTDAGEVTGGKWSPDSAHIAYLAPGRDASGQTTSTLWIANADGSGVKPMNIAVVSIDHLAWANDSQSIAAVQNDPSGKKLVQAMLDGTITPYAYSAPASFNPHNLTTVPGEDRIVFFNEGVFMSLALVSTKYE